VQADNTTVEREPSFPTRLGLLLADPVRGMRGIVSRKTSGFRDSFILVALATVVFRLPDLIRAGRAFSRVSANVALTQLAGILGGEVRTAAFVVLLSALLVVIFAGRGRRDPSLALELGSACYVPYFFAWAPVRLLDLDAWLAYVPGILARVVRVLAWAWVLALVAVAVWVLRRSQPAMATPAPSRRSQYVGFAALSLPAAALALNVVWSAQHYKMLRPLGRADLAPDFVLDRVDGKPGQVRLSGLRGQVVLLDFWATWCPPCLAMMPTLHELYRDWHPRGAEFVGIDSDGPGSRDDLQAFLAQNPFPYPVVLDDRNVGGAYGVSSIPHVAIIGRDGKIVRVFVGGVGREQLEAALAAASE
jgi:cytochrome c biogenesis protein CcmG/thiol:disulfide interchange protein DsbE